MWIYLLKQCLRALISGPTLAGMIQVNLSRHICIIFQPQKSPLGLQQFLGRFEKVTLVSVCGFNDDVNNANMHLLEWYLTLQ